MLGWVGHIVAEVAGLGIDFVLDRAGLRRQPRVGRDPAQERPTRAPGPGTGTGTGTKRSGT